MVRKAPSPRRPPPCRTAGGREAHAGGTGAPCLGDNDMTESGDIIARFAKEGGPAPTFQAYVDGPFKQLLAFYKENAELKKTA